MLLVVVFAVLHLGVSGGGVGNAGEHRGMLSDVSEIAVWIVSGATCAWILRGCVAVAVGAGAGLLADQAVLRWLRPTRW